MTNHNEPKLYTAKMREIARKNAVTYDWAKEITKAVVERAEYMLPYVDFMCENMPSEGFPRTAGNSTLEADEKIKGICPYCGASVAKVHRKGQWQMDPTINPWKVSCPGCQKCFPSNDFGLLYKRGLNEKGEYDRELAYKNNAEAVARGEKDALVNELFPEKDPLWMEDDGFGWSPKDGTYGTLDDNKWAWAAAYHEKIWFNEHDLEANSIALTIERFGQAYLYTGEEKYAYACKKLLLRAADEYPKYDFKRCSLGYPSSHGLGWNGKIIGGIWEHYITVRLMRACDAICPVLTKEESEYLKENIIREAFRGVKSAQIHGNYGMHQKVAALGAVLLDDEAEINEMLDWLERANEREWFGRGARKDYVDPIYGTVRDVRYKCDGGDMGSKYVEEIDHDGFGAEIGITYNKIWFIGTLEIAEILSHCKYNRLDFFKNPKFVKMFDTFIHMTVASGRSRAEGDSGYTVTEMYPFANEMLRGYNVLRDPKLAQAYQYYMKGDLSKIYIDMFTDPEELAESVKNVIATYGEYPFRSDNLTGYGLTVLREGEHKYGAKKQYDTWMYYGRTEQSHAHRDMMQLGVDAYGLNMSPDLGYPEATALTPNRYEWVKATISHNTVVVNGESQVETYTGTSYHYDDTDVVKLVDVDGAVAYEETDIYRRTAVQIAANDEIAYTVDFFRIKGGDTHMYSFHSQSYKGFTSDDVKWEPQVDEHGNYVGTYASPDVEYGHDPYSSDTEYTPNPKYTRGFTWLTEANKGTVDNGNFTIDFKQTDFRGQAVDGDNLHLRYTAVNDWTPDAVDIATGFPPRKKIHECIPGLDYMFIHRKGKDLDTLFTSVLQPYKNTPYIKEVVGLPVQIKDGTEGADDIAKAVRIYLENGLCDYVIYATNNAVTYEVIDGDKTFDFRGFIGVYRMDKNGKNVYNYLNDGDILADVIKPADTCGVYKGKITDFTKVFGFENEIVVSFDESIKDDENLVGRYVYVDSKSKRNTVYRIEAVSRRDDKVVLHLGNTSLIDGLVDKFDLSLGYTYAVEEGDQVRIPLSIVKK